MKTIAVTASKNYNVIIDRNLLQSVGQYAVTVCKGRSVAIISDSNVWPLYGSGVCDSFASAGFSVVNFVFPAGESSKNGENYLAIVNFLAQSHITRSDLIVALGGGVVGDIAGFAAATYLRGVSYIQLPTTLLAMVDSSVGGKTAIDLPAGKNLAGAFYQPSLVLCDLDTLNTLPQDIFLDGCAEVIKYSVLYDNELFAHLTKNGINFSREAVIARCVELKRDVVKEDERDNGVRQKLNLGHTVGHGIEACSNYTIRHGQAVAAGMAVIAKASAAAKLCSQDTYARILNVLNKFNLPTQTEFQASDLFSAALSDKKRSDNDIQLIVPIEIGQCDIYSLPVAQLLSFLQAGL